MREILIIAALAALTTACGSRESEERANFIAAGMGAILPRSLGDGMTMTKARAEGSGVILTIQGVPGEELDRPELQTELKQLICSDQRFRDAIGKGVAIGFDLDADNGKKSEVRVKSCA
jgi:hypothetical protein